MNGQVIAGHPYSVTDIQHYLEGSLSVAEMHAIESAALDDPFLADAIDGVSENLHIQQAGYFDAGMDDLKRRLQERIASKRSVIILSSNSTWWKAAAAVIIVLAASAITFNYFVRNSAPPPDIVLSNSAKEADSPAANIDSKPAVDIGIQQEHEANNSSAKNRNVPSSAVAAKRAPDKGAAAEVNNDTIISDAVSSVRPVQSDSIALAYAPVRPSGDSTNKSLDVQLQGKDAGVMVDKSSASEIILLKGHVTGQSKDAIAGAIVSIEKAKKTTTTDAEGNFILPVNQADTGIDLLVTAVGYDSKSVSVRPAENAEPLVQLHPSSVALNEVVVTGYNADSKRAKSRQSVAIASKKSNAFKDAAPIDGWDAFKKYMDDNKQIASPDSVLKGNEIVSFNVDAQGNLSHFSVSQSISPAHDTKVIGLIKNGPQWKLVAGKKARITLSISY